VGEPVSTERSQRRSQRRTLGEVPHVPTGRITALDERRAGSARYLLAVEGTPVAVISAELIARHGVRVGAAIDAAAAEALARDAAQLSVFDKAVQFLAARARSGRELQLRLRRAGAPDDLIAPALERLRALGFLNDDEYARHLARSRAVGGGASRRRIAQELQRRGVDRRVADRAIEGVLEEVELDEEGAARAVAEKRLRSLRNLDADAMRRRLYGYLARRGYDGDIIVRVLRELLA
jgi:regulatory protein